MYLFRLYIFILSLAAGAALMFAAPLAAQTPSAAALTEDPLPDGRARVVVEAADTTGRPLAYATVSFTAADGRIYAAATLGDGRALFSLPAGEYGMAVEYIGYDTRRQRVAERGALLSKELKRLCNYGEGGNTGFDTVITRLQMQAYLTVGDFVYMQDKYGKPYGWGIAKYTTPEALFGYDFVTSAYGREQEESRARIIAHLESILPGVNEKQILKLIG